VSTAIKNQPFRTWRTPEALITEEVRRRFFGVPDAAAPDRVPESAERRLLLVFADFLAKADPEKEN
jgi:hypothetical protein